MFKLIHTCFIAIGVALTMGILALPLQLLAQGEPDKTTKTKKAKERIDSVESFPLYIKVPGDPGLKETSSKRFFMGKNYRNEWVEPVKASVLNFSKAGYVPVKEGGGKQTRSLKIEDSNGNGWSLRSIKKFPEHAIPAEFRKTLVEKLVKDGISASYPYGILSIATLSNAAKVPYFETRLAYIPDDPKLGKFRAEYKNVLVSMVDKYPAGIKLSIIDTDENVKTVSTQKIVYELQQSNQYKVDQASVLQARLLDNFIMDFDRHEGQWEWMKADSANDKIYFPAPKDHDQAFFSIKGLIPKIAKMAIPEMQGFRAKAKNSTTFNRPARNFDRYFLTELNREQWESGIDAFLHSMSDSVIEEAVRQQPAEIYSFNGPKITKALKKKRKHFKKEMVKYYKHLSQIVSITGSNEPEQFNIVTNPNGWVIVTVNRLDKAGDLGSATYERTFDPDITKEIRIYGLEGDDKFVVAGSSSKIRIRMIGGPGEDVFVNKSEMDKLWAYDVNTEKNTISGNGIKDRISADPMNNEFTRLGHKYNKAGFGIFSQYPFDGGLYLGLTYRMIKQGFRKDPYASSQELIAGRTIYTDSYLFRYYGTFTKLIGNTDLLIRGEYFLPTSRTNFFGLGNETVFDKTKPGGKTYYRARYEFGNFTVLARTPFNSWMNITYGPSLQYFKLRSKENEGKYISDTDLPGVDMQSLKQQNFFGGGEFNFNINTKNDAIIPTRGLSFKTSVRSLFPINASAGNITQVGGNVSLYTDFISKKHLVLATTFGAQTNVGEFQFPQAQFLGFTQNLRGYRIQRFSGRTRAYNNVELRWKIANMNTYLFPASIGLLAFNDVGRVWMEGEKSSVWHDGYGAGIWIAPLDRIVMTGSLTYSKEEKNLGLITVGFQF